MNHLFQHQPEGWLRPARLILLSAGLALLALLLGAGPVRAAPAAQGSSGPWQAWYWNNSSLLGTPVFYQLEAAPGLDVGSGSPVPGRVGDDFSALWVGTTTTSSGRYTFAARVDDGVRLWVDSRLVLDDWQAGAARVLASTVSLSAGVHAIRIEYFDARDTALLQLEWGQEGTVALAGQTSVPPPPVSSAGAVPQGQSLTIGDDFMGGGPLGEVGRQFSLNARTGPGVGYPVVTIIGGGTPVEMLYRWQAGRWIAVQLPNGVIGWVNATYLNAEFATGNLPEWRADPQQIASPVVGAPPAGPVTGPAPTPGSGNGPLATMTGAFVLNARTGPGIAYPVVTTISRGETVEMLYRWGPGVWVAVRLPNGLIGWVNATYLSADFATGNLPEWRSDPQLVASPAR